jgi:hypothetical protein
MKFELQICLQTIQISALALVCYGCQGHSPVVHSLAEMKHLEARKLAAECYRSSEGFRFVYGDGTIWGACMEWARDRVDPQLPSRRR